MFFLLVQTFFWIVLAFILGLVVGWWLKGRSQGEANKQFLPSKAASSSSVSASGTSGSYVSDNPRTKDSISVKSAPVMPAASSQADEAPPVKTQSATNEPAEEETIVLPDLAQENEDETVETGSKPQAVSAENKDDLKRIKGVGPVIEQSLNEIGVYTFKQISEFSEENITWVDSHVSFPGRIKREEWVSQASELVDNQANDKT